MTCEYCDILAGKGKSRVLHQDAELVVAIKDHVTAPGQITIFTKEHFTILELVPPNVLEACAIASKKVSVAVFEALGATGTTILVENGIAGGQKIPHFGIEVIPRREGDDLPLSWEAKPMMEDELAATFQAIMAEPEVKQVTQEEVDKEETPDQGGTEESPEEEKKEEDNELLKSLRRIP